MSCFSQGDRIGTTCHIASIRVVKLSICIKTLFTVIYSQGNVDDNINYNRVNG